MHLLGREKEHFSNQIVPNPRGQPALQNTHTSQFEIGSGSNREVQAIHTLRSGKKVDNQVQAPPNNSNLINEKEKENPKDSTKKEDQVVVDNQEKSFQPKTPFPQRLQQTRKKNHCKRILKVFKNVQINITFLDAINQIPSYAKFPKDLPTVKRKSSVPREATFATQVFCLIQQPIAPKYEVPGSPTISVRIGDQVMDQCLLDLG